MVLKLTHHNSLPLKSSLLKGNKGNGYEKQNTSIIEKHENCKSIEKSITSSPIKYKE